MIYLIRRLLWTAVLWASAALFSCVDKDYDLTDVDTDEIAVGDQLVLPLGSGVISADDLLDVKKNDEVKVDGDGNYVLSYSGQIEIDPPAELGFSDSRFQAVELGIPGSLPPDAGDFESDGRIVFDAGECDLTFETSDIARLDSVWFDTERGRSRLYFDLSCRDIRLDRGEAALHFTAVFPKGCRLVPEDAGSGSFSGNEYSCTVPFAELRTGKRIGLRLETAVVGTDDRIAYGAELLVKKGSSISVAGTPAVQIGGGLASPDYQVIFGQVESRFSGQSVDISTQGLSDLFEGDDNVLSFADPRIRLEAVSGIGIPMQASFRFESVNDRSGQTQTESVEHISIDAPRNVGETAETNLWLGSVQAGVKPPYEFVRCEINDLIRISPDRIFIDTEVAPDADAAGLRFFSKGASARVGYTAEIPLAPAADFRARTDQRVDDVFDKDLIDYLFSGGTVEISGTVENSLPVNFSMNLIIADANDQSVGIRFEPRTVLGSPDGTAVSSSVTYTITRQDMPKMETARNLRIALDAYADDKLAGRSLRPDQQAKLILKVRKTGGILIK